MARSSVVRRVSFPSRLLDETYQLRRFAENIRLDESIADLAAGKEVPRYKWIHVASEGHYKGHWMGEFRLTRATFESFVRNLHDHPQYEVGSLTLGGAPANDVGVRPTIQFDYEHASEMPPTEGTIARFGAPAPAWVCDVEVRDAPDGSAQLWALADLGDQIRGQIQRNEYRFVSIAFDLEHDNWLTGEPQGPTLTSIAFTNHPFLKQLQSYAASVRRAGLVRENQLQHRASGNEAPGQPQTRGSNPMNVRASSSDNSNSQSDDGGFRIRICTALRISTRLADDDIAEAAADAGSGASALKKMLESLGVKDADGALKVIPDLMAKRQQLADLLAEFDQLLAGQQAQEAAMADSDVAAALTAKGWGEDAKRATLNDRNHTIELAERDLEKKAPKDESGKPKVSIADRIKCRVEARTAWLKEMGVSNDGDVDTSNLGKTLAAGKGGVQLRVDGRAGARPTPAPGRVIRLDDEGQGATGGDVVDLTKQMGDNPTDKVIRHLSSKDPEFAKLPHITKCKRASEFQTANQVLF